MLGQCKWTPCELGQVAGKNLRFQLELWLTESSVFCSEETAAHLPFSGNESRTVDGKY